MLYNDIVEFIATLDVCTIPEERKVVLHKLVEAIAQKINEQQPVRLNCICTHNSRRSHFAQVWAQVMAYHHGVNNIYCYSGGTEATALFPTVVETLRLQGLHITPISGGENPVYSIKYAPNEPAIVGFSKTYDHPFNPTSEYIALMTCSQADEACPIVLGAEQRIALTYNDPKLFDGSPLQAEKYSERSREIATEFLYIFSSLQG